MTYWIIYVSTIITLTFICVIGYSDTIIGYFFTFLMCFIIAVPIFFGSYFIGDKLESKVKVAKRKELKREDDILLQAVGFSQSTLIILLNILVEASDVKTFVTITVIICAVTFYAVRAWAKLKNNSKCRYYSMIILAFLIGFSLYSIFIVLRETFPDYDLIFCQLP